MRSTKTSSKSEMTNMKVIYQLSIVRFYAVETKSFGLVPRYFAYDVHVDLACDYLIEAVDLYRQAITQTDKAIDELS